MTEYQRLSHFLNIKNLSITEVAKMLGTSQPSLSAILKGDRPLSRGMKARFSKLFPDLDSTWLETGEGEMLKSDCQDSAEDELADNPFIIPLIPAMAMAGALPDISQSVFREQCKRVQAPVAGCDFAIQVSGDSMLPDFKSGDYLAVSKINDSRMLPFSIPVLLDTSEGALLKCLEPCDADTLMAVSLNKAFSPYPIPKDIILGVYRIRAVFRIINTL